LPRDCSKHFLINCNYETTAALGGDDKKSRLPSLGKMKLQKYDNFDM